MSGTGHICLLGVFDRLTRVGYLVFFQPFSPVGKHLRPIGHGFVFAARNPLFSELCLDDKRLGEALVLGNACWSIGVLADWHMIPFNAKVCRSLIQGQLHHLLRCEHVVVHEAKRRVSVFETVIQLYSTERTLAVHLEHALDTATLRVLDIDLTSLESGCDWMVAFERQTLFSVW